MLLNLFAHVWHLFMPSYLWQVDQAVYSILYSHSSLPFHPLFLHHLLPLSLSLALPPLHLFQSILPSFLSSFPLFFLPSAQFILKFDDIRLLTLTENLFLFLSFFLYLLISCTYTYSQRQPLFLSLTLASSFLLLPHTLTLTHSFSYASDEYF